jgi:hypothetical protein
MGPGGFPANRLNALNSFHPFLGMSLYENDVAVVS